VFTRRRVLALLLLVEAVDPTIRTAEVSVGVPHLLHAGDLAEQLAPRGLHRGRGSLEVVHPEAENDAAFVEAVVGDGLGRVQIQHRPVRHDEQDVALVLHGRGQAERLGQQRLGGSERLGFEDDGVPGYAFHVHGLFLPIVATYVVANCRASFSIHPSAWNRNSANFAFWGFSEVAPPLTTLHTWFVS